MFLDPQAWTFIHIKYLNIHRPSQFIVYYIIIHVNSQYTYAYSVQRSTIIRPIYSFFTTSLHKFEWTLKADMHWKVLEEPFYTIYILLKAQLFIMYNSRNVSDIFYLNLCKENCYLGIGTFWILNRLIIIEDNILPNINKKLVFQYHP